MPTVRVMRGQCVVREIEPIGSASLWTPGPGQREQKTHRGVVLAIGKPAIHGKCEVPWGFDVGDVVQFHFEHNQEAATRTWPEDGKPATWLPQVCVVAVWDAES